MVQRKEAAKHASQAEPGEPKRQSSFQQEQKQDTRSRGGGALKKKLKMERSIMAADLDSLRGFDVKPNYMKPTSCSNARAERLQVKNNPKTLRIRPSTKNNLKGVVFNRATCSSTLRHSKFPTALDLSPGGTEAEGTSVVKVCPYSYCSLNGHRHEPLPPLKHFVSARRNLLKKGIGTAGLSGSKITRPTEEVYDDFFVEIYTESPELISESEKLSDEAVDVMMSFLELCSEDGAESSYPESKTECSECFDDDFGFPTLYSELLPVEKTIFPHKEETPPQVIQAAATEDDAGCSEELYGLDVLDLNPELYELESSAEGDDYLGFKDFREAASVEQEEGTETEDAENDSMEPDGLQIQKFLVSGRSEEDGNGAEDDADSLSIATADISVPEIQSGKCNGETEDIRNPSEAKNSAFFEGKKNFIDPELMKARLRITRKKMIEDLELTKEFNPRGPRFLELEADPEAEKVDLRHQTMDERKNSEEWMVDYALRQAVMKMAPARKRKVALLVEAFETVAPLPVWENPSRHATSGLSLARIIQACN